MKILVQGGGGREYALASNFAKHGHKVVGCPGNAAFKYMGIGDTHPYEGSEQFAGYFEEGKFDLAVAGGEDPLRDGLGDIMHYRGLPFFGPRRLHARAEWDKGYLHDLLAPLGLVPHGRVLRAREGAIHYLKSIWRPEEGEEYVVKSTALREGKGVFVPDTLDEAVNAVNKVMLPPPKGWGDDVLIQRKLTGEELSTMTIVGRGNMNYKLRTKNFESSKDNKPVGPNNFGLDPRLNTGGMGGDSPNSYIDPYRFDELLYTHTIPMIKALEEDADIGQMVGLVYNGLMIQERMVRDRVKIIESNCGRFGDPEAQYLISRLKSDLTLYLKAAVDGELHKLPDLEFDPRPSATLIMATPGYPTSEYKNHTGKRLRGLDIIKKTPDMHVFFAGVGEQDGHLINIGGRVFAVSILGRNREEAWNDLYKIVDKGRAIGIGDGPEDVHFRLDLRDPLV
jgi:phosphoribosylamine--glycine ligase